MSVDQILTNLLEMQFGLRVGVFGAVLSAMMVLEQVFPRRKRIDQRARRWTTNLGLVVFGNLAIRILFPITVVETAIICEKSGWGLFHLISASWWFEALLAFLVLDFIIYVQHVAFHHLSWAWRIHKIHHADRDMDASTAIRFHPVEYAVSMLLKMAVIILIGPAAVIALIFEIALNAFAIFNHANFNLPKKLDHLVRYVIVTPDMHRVHHSVDRNEHDKNFGFCLSIWDRLFRTYKAQPVAGHADMTIGLEEMVDEATSSLRWVLLAPFLRSQRVKRESNGPQRQDRDIG